MGLQATEDFAFNKEVTIGTLEMPGQLYIPDAALGIVLFAHGSGSSRFSIRNQYVAEFLHKRRVGTLLFDLLSADEERNRHNIFDIEFLAERLDDAKRWLLDIPDAQGLPFAYFGASTGAAAALYAAANSPDNIKAIVARGGRPDLAGAALGEVKAPTLLIVGGADTNVIELNQKALSQLKCHKQLEIIPGATHLFSERGALEKVANLANAWFVRFFA